MLKDSFCSSPWFHLRIDPAGYFLPCRWGTETKSKYHISTTSIAEYMNSTHMSNIRTQMLNGQGVGMCSTCRYEDKHGNVSGRRRQLLKSAIKLEEFDKTFCASPHWDLFESSANTHGESTKLPVDLQIDLGNTCNSACIMCTPEYSSRLERDYIQLANIAPDVPAFKVVKKYPNWSDDPTLIDKFISELEQLPNIGYIHFIGGETLFMKSFYTICERLIANGTSRNISIGTTTNGTVYNDQLTNIINNFKNVHLGISIETATPLNDYIRYPSEVDQVLSNIDKFVELRAKTGLHLSLRITPNVFTIYHIDSIFELMISKRIMIESDMLFKPACLRIELIDDKIKADILARIDNFISKYNLVNSEVVINRRTPELLDQVITNAVMEHKHFLETFKPLGDVELQRKELVKLIRAFESIRANRILEYIPEYEEFLRSAGY